MSVIKICLGDTKMPDGTPLKDIVDTTPSDVLCGRGGGTNHHQGNNYWRALVAANKRLYISLPKKQKALVAKSIVHTIRSAAAPGKPGGRFLQKDGKTNLWSDIGDSKAVEKTSQALREGAPGIRSEMESAIEKGYYNINNNGRGKNKRKPVLEAVDYTAGPYRPGQLLPNGLITLDYSGVAAACSKKKARLYNDGVTDLSMAEQAGIVGRRDGQVIGSGGNDPMMHAFQQFMGAKQQQTAVLPSAQTTAAAAVQASVAPPPNTMSWDKQLLIKLHQQQQTQQSQQNANMAEAVAAAAALQKTTTFTNTPTQLGIMQPQQVQQNMQQAQQQWNQLLLQQKNIQNQAKQAIAQAQQSYAQHQVQQQLTQLKNQTNLPTNNNNSVGMNQYQALAQHLLSRDYPMPSSSPSTASKTNATADASGNTTANDNKTEAQISPPIINARDTAKTNATSHASGNTTANDNITEAQASLAPVTHRDMLKVFRDATAAGNDSGPLGILATAAFKSNPANNKNSLSTPATGINANNHDIRYAAAGGSKNSGLTKPLATDVYVNPNYAAAAGGGGSKGSEMTRDVALEIIRKERARREALSHNASATGGLEVDNLSSLINQRVLNKSGAGNDNYSRLVNQQQGGLNGLAGYSDLTRGLSRGRLGLTTSVGLAREAAAAGLDGGRGSMSLLNNSLPNSSPLAAEYLAQVQRDKNTNSIDSNMGTTKTEAGTSSVQNSPNISSMSDDEIRAMLNKIRNESSQATKLQQNISGSSFSNLIAFTDLLRNESFLGDAGSLGGNGQSLASALSLNQRQISSELEKYKNLVGNNGNSNLSPPSLGGTESIALQKAIQDAMHYLDPLSGSNFNSTTQLESAESLGPTPLRPGVSATLAQMRIDALLNDHNSVDGTANQGRLGSDVTKRVFWVPTENISKLEEARLRNRFQSNSGEESKVDMTSSPQRGQSGGSLGGSLDDLCRAAGIHMELQNSLKLPQKNTKKKSKKKKTKKKVSKLKPGKNDQSLLDDSDSDDSDDDDKPMASLSTKRKRDSRSTSFGSHKGGKRPVKHRLLSTAKAKVDKGPSIQFKNGTKDPQATNITTNLASQPSFSRVIESMPEAETTLDRGHSLAMSEISKVSSIQFKNDGGNQRTKDPQATNITTNLASQPSFSRVIGSIPMTETTLDRGHSLAMSEISLDHPSVPRQLEECQFDDASEEDEEGEGGLKE